MQACACSQLCSTNSLRTSTDDIKPLRLITAIKTPYLPDGRFDLEAYDSLVNMQNEDGADDVIVGGTTGKGQLMSWDEKKVTQSLQI
ncbi:4-hydroxy-tetrahydrodipicolinate synthase, chloroplastic-like protein [Tanacetum coccineum]